jgi:hypothetical protein
VTTGDTDWRAFLVALDQPVELPPRALPEPEPGRGDGLEVPRVFDHTAAESRFGELVARIEDAFGVQCEHGHPQDSACFGSVRIPAEATRTRTKRTRTPCAVEVAVSAFGSLAAYRAVGELWDQVVPVHPDDGQRIEEALEALGYVIVPMEVLATPYDGPNGWVFGASPYGSTGTTWYTRFFGVL